MKKILAVMAFAAMLSPSVSFAAYDDVSLTTDTVVTAGGINLNVAGSTATIESIEVASDGNSFTVILAENSSLEVTSSDRRVLTTDAPGKYIITDTCDASVSTLKLASYGATQSVIVTPQSTTCTLTTLPSSSGSGTRNRGGGGGGGGSSNAVATVAKPAAPATSQAVNAPGTVVAAKAKLIRALKVGSTGMDVKVLQEFLNANGFKVSESGVGSPGNETTYMGKLTVEAVKKFQAKYGIVSAGTPETTGYGAFGPKTRAKVNELSGK